MWQLLAIVALVAGGLGIYRAFWDPTLSNYELYVGGYLAIFSIATVWAFSSAPPIRRSLIVFVVFGWVYLVVVLRAGFEIATMQDALWLARNTQLGLCLAALTAVTGYLAFSVFRTTRE